MTCRGPLLVCARECSRGHAGRAPPERRADAASSTFRPNAADPPEELDMTDDFRTQGGPSRRSLLKWGAVGAAAVGLGAGRALEPSLARQGLLSEDGAVDAAAGEMADGLYIAAVPTRPLQLSPFTDPPVTAPAPRPLSA